MLKNSHAFSGFSVDDLAKAKEFYSKTLGLDVSENEMGLSIKIAGGNPIFVYPKDGHKPASYTMLNFPVEDIEKVVEELAAKGVTFEQYDLGGWRQNRRKRHYAWAGCEPRARYSLVQGRSRKYIVCFTRKVA